MKKTGFTLIELMVVMAVIATLATIGFFGLSRMQAVGRDTQRMQFVNGLRTALTKFQSDAGYYPWGGFSNAVNLVNNERYFASLPADPGCGGGPATFPVGALSNADWQPCVGQTRPGYSYTLGSDNKYTIYLRKEAGGDLEFGAGVETRPVPTYKACAGVSCATLFGNGPRPGEVVCSSDNDCSHTECVSGSCARILGGGVDSCTGTGQGLCWHSACQSGSCNVSSGPGPVDCTGDGHGTCWHNGCSGTSCSQISGGGGDSCIPGNDRGVCWHNGCSGPSCTTVSGGGGDSCGRDCECTDTCPGPPGGDR